MQRFLSTRRVTVPPGRGVHFLPWAAVVLLSGSCSSPERIEHVKVSEAAAIPNDVPSLGPACDDRVEGDACGDARHCKSGRCVPDECGDGFKSDDEQCDDGNFATGDGCTPSCGLEYVHCPNGDWTTVGQGCADGGVATDASVAKAPDAKDCPKPSFITVPREVRLQADGAAVTVVALPGATPELTIHGLRDGEVIWRASDGGPWTTELFTSPAKVTTEFKCPMRETQFSIAATSVAVGCASVSFTAFVSCTVKANDRPVTTPPPAPAADAGVTDAGVKDAGVSDAGPVTSPQDGGPQKDAAVDSGTSDAGPGQPTGTKFRRPACETCLMRACVNYSGVDLTTPCFGSGGASSDFATRCASVFTCSLNSPDHCADNVALGPLECFCGVGVDVDACSASPSAVKGRCKAEWYAASGCATDDQKCALGTFNELTLPAGNAKFLFECMLDQCAEDCAP
jgi:cysteine-rich repeat protein